MADKLYKLKVESTAGSITVSDVEEFVVGYKYLFIRTAAKGGNQGETMSLRRDAISKIRRCSDGRTWRDVLMKQFKKKEKKKAQELSQNNINSSENTSEQIAGEVNDSK